ncbi:MAG: CpsD/CapB family tyrosine-protein kinase [Oscillospiraceae bacterium]|nr:CpsD/CapB family tyrosine-protein kinase [Oscillospiraceae bacterium]MDD4414972.1 CpsD/CapB family tyrosine-protein kinase [Oscillospiraceae bacterium]
MKDNIKAAPITNLGSSKKLDRLMISESAPFHIREAFKTIRTNLLFTLATKESKTFAVASAMPNEGKSTTAANLSVVLAQTGAQVLLMDCDFRKPSVHRLFRLSADKGLTSILCGIDKIEEALNENVVPNLDIITAGPMSPNPSELLGSSRMAELLSIVQKAYDYVVIDASPINIVSDAVIIAKQTAGVVLVTRQGQSRHDQLQKAIESCKFAEVDILGIVLNESKGANSHYYGYRYNQQEKDK